MAVRGSCSSARPSVVLSAPGRIESLPRMTLATCTLWMWRGHSAIPSDI